MEFYYSLSILIVLSAIFSYANERFLKLPSTIGIMLIALVASVVLIATGSYYRNLFTDFIALLENFDLSKLLLDVMLSFLLFAGAIHVKLTDLRRERNAIFIFSTISVIISTFIVGILMYYLFILFDYPVPLIQCLLFGSLISPTDPVAVLSILKQSNVPRSIEVRVAGESLFNDGVAVLLFTIFIGIASGKNVDITFGNISAIFLKEVGGGILLGVIIGYLASLSIKKIDNYKVEVLITLAVVMGGSMVARYLGVSAPLSMVAAGIIIGNYGKNFAMSDLSKDYLDKFWEMTDEIFNAILFLIIGFELLLLPKLRYYIPIGMATVAIVLIARLLSIVIPSRIVAFKRKFNKATLVILVWGGIRGGVSIALALSLDRNLNQRPFLAITYIVVLFSIIVQGLSIGKITDRLLGKKRKNKKSITVLPENITQKFSDHP